MGIGACDPLKHGDWECFDWSKIEYESSSDESSEESEDTED